jgi:hypothetical protein
MGRLGLSIAVLIVVAACGGGTDSPADGTSEAAGRAAGDTVDPCTLIDETTLNSYFGQEAVEPEQGETGPLVNCRWRDANANSLLVQVASDHELNRPEPCDGCVDLPVGDDGYISASAFQSTAGFVVGTTFYSVTSTGFGDDEEAMAALAETVFATATA